MQAILNKVTITGADDSVSSNDLIELQEKYPFVEWGILLSASSQGSNRFPPFDWIETLFNNNLHLSGHFCGRWVRDICAGNWGFINSNDVLNSFVKELQRIQLNFHAYTHKIEEQKFIRGLKQFRDKQFIFQVDNVNNELCRVAVLNKIDAVGLYDLSGGCGVLPTEWPRNKTYAGYAGGLSPDNITEQLECIEKVCRKPIWIDVETHVRSDNDVLFDLNKAEAFLEATRPWVLESKYAPLPV